MIERNGRLCDVPPGRVMRRNLSQLGSDVITLVELQAELLQVDMRTWGRSFVKSLIALVAALTVLLASLPVLLISLGYLIDQWTDLSLGVSMLIAGVIGIVLAGALAFAGIRLMKRQDGVLSRFSAELKQNMRWLKQVLSNPTEGDGLHAAKRS